MTSFLYLSGIVDLAELDGPFVKISLKGRFWHKRSTVLARVSNYLKQRIPVSLSFVLLFHSCCIRIITNTELHISHFSVSRLQNLFPLLCFGFQEILEVDIEDEKQLDDSPANF